VVSRDYPCHTWTPSWSVFRTQHPDQHADRQTDRQFMLCHAIYSNSPLVCIECMWCPLWDNNKYICPRYITKPTRSTQLCIPLGSLNLVPALSGWGKDGNVTFTGCQLTLCDAIWLVNSRSVEACCNCYTQLLYFAVLYWKQACQAIMLCTRDGLPNHLIANAKFLFIFTICDFGQFKLFNFFG